MWETLPKSLSTFSDDMDKLFWDITYLMTFSFIVSASIMIYLFVAFRKKEGVKGQYIAGEGGKQMLLIYIPLAIFVCFDMYIDVSTAAVWKKAKVSLPPADVTVRAIAQQWAWTFVQEGNIQTVNEMHIPAGKTVHVEMESSDTLHSLSIPVFRFKQDVIPGRIITGWFKTQDFSVVKDAKNSMVARYEAGAAQGKVSVAPHEDTEGSAVFDIQCAEMCGVGHGIMSATVVIHSQEDYDAWVKTEKETLHEMQEDAGAAPEAAPAEAAPVEEAPAAEHHG